MLIVTHNLGPAVEGSNDMANLDLLAYRAHVVTLQESKYTRPPLAEWAESREFGYFKPEPRERRNGASLTILWRPEFVLEAAEVVPLAPPTRVQSEAAGPTLHLGSDLAVVRLRRADDCTVITVATCHLMPSSHLGGAALAVWRKERDALLAWWSQQCQHVIVTGDFNKEPDHPHMAPVRNVAAIQSAPSHGTRSIDLVLTKPSAKRLGVTALDPAPDGHYDHRPVLANVRWGGFQ